MNELLIAALHAARDRLVRLANHTLYELEDESALVLVERAIQQLGDTSTPAAPPQPVAERMRQLLAEWQAEDEPNREQLLEMLRNMGAIAPPPMDAPDGETAP